MDSKEPKSLFEVRRQRQAPPAKPRTVSLAARLDLGGSFDRRRHATNSCNIALYCAREARSKLLKLCCTINQLVAIDDTVLMVVLVAF